MQDYSGNYKFKGLQVHYYYSLGIPTFLHIKGDTLQEERVYIHYGYCDDQCPWQLRVSLSYKDQWLHVIRIK